MKVKAAERAQAREAAKKEARQKAMDKFLEIQTAKAAERAKELERQKKAQKLPTAKTKPTPAVTRITTDKMNSFEEDLGHSTNPFDEEISNPFLDDIRAASAAASALSFGGNPFEEAPGVGRTSQIMLPVQLKLGCKYQTSLSVKPAPNIVWACLQGKQAPFVRRVIEFHFHVKDFYWSCNTFTFGFLVESSSIPDSTASQASSVETAETDAAQTPTEDMINKLIDDFQLYQDPYLKAVITECHGRTPLHVAVAEKHEDVVNCFVDFQGRLLYQTTNYSKVNVFFG